MLLLRYLSLLGVLVATAPATAQIAPTSPGRQRAANREAQREARRTVAPYKDSHLDVTRQHLRRGESEPLTSAPGEPQFRRDGTPRISSPGPFAHWRRHPKNEPKP